MKELIKKYFVFVILYVIAVAFGAILTFLVAPTMGLPFAIIGYIVPHLTIIIILWAVSGN